MQLLNDHDESAEEQAKQAQEAQRVIRQVNDAIDDVDAVRNRLTDLYRGAKPGTPVEIEIGDALQSVRAAMKRLRKAREELVNQPLPGM
jgi:methyl-accepting chemotaxis protein